MINYIIRRLFICVIILFGVSILIYSILRMMPGDYIEKTMAQIPGITDEAINRLKALYGLDKNIFQGYLDWFSKAIAGNLGDSFVYKKPVVEVIASKMWTSFWLAFVAFVLEIMIAIPLGIISATKQYSKLDYSITAFSLIGISLPSFFFAAILQYVFAQKLRIFPLQGMITARADYVGIRQFLDLAWHFCLPVILFVVTSIGGLMRYSRTNMLEVLNADYIRTARAKGLNESAVIYKHAFRNTLIPIVTMIGGTIPGLFSGAIITENIFAIQGLGQTAYKSLQAGDIPFIMGFNMFLAVLTLLGTLISDILYATVDPRIRLN